MQVEAINNNIHVSYNGCHSQKIKTNSNKEELKQNTKIALGAFCGAITPVIILNAFKKGNIDNIANAFKNNLPFKDKFNSIWNMFEIESFWQILATTVGGICGGFLTGIKNCNSKEEKQAKQKEGIFEFLNNMIPTSFVALGSKGLKKINKDKSLPYQAFVIIGSVISGMFIANKTSNKINEKVFDKDKENKDIRKFKPTDCLVHVDDLVNLAVLAKLLPKKFNIDKLLPLIYTRCGFEIGTTKAAEHSDENQN